MGPRQDSESHRAGLDPASCGRDVGGTNQPVVVCPADRVNRGQMAVFLVKTFGLLLYGP